MALRSPEGHEKNLFRYRRNLVLTYINEKKSVLLDLTEFNSIEVQILPDRVSELRYIMPVLLIFVFMLTCIADTVTWFMIIWFLFLINRSWGHRRLQQWKVGRVPRVSPRREQEKQTSSRVCSSQRELYSSFQHQRKQMSGTQRSSTSICGYILQGREAQQYSDSSNCGWQRGQNWPWAPCYHWQVKLSLW